jgi:hypothetical protein
MLRLVGVVLMVAAIGSSIVCVVVWNRGRAQQHAALLRGTAGTLDVPPAGLGRCLEASGATLELWAVRGVPRAHQARVRRLAATASALRRRLPADDARRLIELQCLAAVSADANRRWLRERFSRAAAQSRRVVSRRGPIVITSR